MLQLDPEDVLAGDDVLDLIDKAVSKWVGILVLNGREANGGRLYEAACKLKSVVRDRAYLLISERVDIAAAANASGILLSDQGRSSAYFTYDQLAIGNLMNRSCNNQLLTSSL